MWGSVRELFTCQAPTEGARLCHALRYDLHLTSNAQLAPWRKRLVGPCWVGLAGEFPAINGVTYGVMWPRIAKRNQTPGMSD